LVPAVQKSFILYSRLSSAFCIICEQVTGTQKLETIRCKEQPVPYPYPTHVQYLLHSLPCKHQNDFRRIHTTVSYQNFFWLTVHSRLQRHHRKRIETILVMLTQGTVYVQLKMSLPYLQKCDTGRYPGW